MNPLTVISSTDQRTLKQQLARWKQAEEGLEHCTLFARVMQGLCLSELRKLHGSEKGGRPKTSEKIGGFLPWAEVCRKELGYSDDKARLLIQMSDAAKPRLRKLAENAQAGLGTILDKPMSQLSDAEFSALKTVTHKLTDGKTNQVFQEELGLFKTPGKLGGYHPAAVEKTTEEKIEAFKAAARNESFQAFDALDGLKTRWQFLEDFEIQAAIHVAETFVKSAHAWLKVPPSKRTRSDAAEILGLTEGEQI